MNKADREEFPRYEFMAHFENEANRKMPDIEALWKLSMNDPTIRHFLDAWRTGVFASFNDMVCSLAVWLATEKADYLKTATNPPPPPDSSKHSPDLFFSHVTQRTSRIHCGDAVYIDSNGKARKCHDTQ